MITTSFASTETAKAFFELLDGTQLLLKASTIGQDHHYDRANLGVTPDMIYTGSTLSGLFLAAGPLDIIKGTIGRIVVTGIVGLDGKRGMFRSAPVMIDSAAKDKRRFSFTSDRKKVYDVLGISMLPEFPPSEPEADTPVVVGDLL